MAEAYLTGPELITLNDRNLSEFDVPNMFTASPFMRVAAATPASQNTVHKYLRVVLPTAGFRTENLGREVDKSVSTAQTLNLKIMDATFKTDLALADEFKDGRDAWVDREAAYSLEAAMLASEKQVFQGTVDGDALGFNGFPDEASLNNIVDENVINAGGAANLTSVYLVRFGPRDVEVVWGSDGNIEVEPYSVIEAQPASGTGTYPALYVPVTGWNALKIGSTVSSVVRIANIDSTSGSSFPVTDDMIYEGLEKFEDGRGPNAIFMHRRCAEQLRKARTSYNPIGTPAEQITNIEGIPVYRSEGISVAETVVPA